MLQPLRPDLVVWHLCGCVSCLRLRGIAVTACHYCGCVTWLRLRDLAAVAWHVYGCGCMARLRLCGMAAAVWHGYGCVTWLRLRGMSMSSAGCLAWLLPRGMAAAAWHVYGCGCVACLWLRLFGMSMAAAVWHVYGCGCMACLWLRLCGMSMTARHVYTIITLVTTVFLKLNLSSLLSFFNNSGLHDIVSQGPGCRNILQFVRIQLPAKGVLRICHYICRIFRSLFTSICSVGTICKCRKNYTLEF